MRQGPSEPTGTMDRAGGAAEDAVGNRKSRSPYYPALARNRPKNAAFSTPKHRITAEYSHASSADSYLAYSPASPTPESVSFASLAAE